jgi:hypothetical protein
MSFLSYLSDLRPVLATLTGLDEGAVVIVENQDLAEIVAQQVQLNQACVLLGFTGGTADADPRSALSNVANTMEVEAWTPAVMLRPSPGPTTNELAEKIMVGLHGYRVAPALASITGLPAFTRWTIREETGAGPDRTKYLVANLQFTVRLNPSA